MYRVYLYNDSCGHITDAGCVAKTIPDVVLCETKVFATLRGIGLS